MSDYLTELAQRRAHVSVPKRSAHWHTSNSAQPSLFEPATATAAPAATVAITATLQPLDTERATHSYIASIGGTNGTVTLSDVPRLRAATGRVLDLLRDGLWHTADEIDAAAGVRSADKRRRELRNLSFTGQDGNTYYLHVEGRTTTHPGLWEFRAVAKSEPQAQDAGRDGAV